MCWPIQTTISTLWQKLRTNLGSSQVDKHHQRLLPWMNFDCHYTHPKTAYSVLLIADWQILVINHQKNSSLCFWLSQQRLLCSTQAVLPSPIFWAKAASTTLLRMLRNYGSGANIPSPCYLTKWHRLWKGSQWYTKPWLRFNWKVFVLLTVNPEYKTKIYFQCKKGQILDI